MINANEAKALYDKSGAEVDQYLKTAVEPAVKKAAEGGKRSTHIHLGCVGQFDYLDQKIKPIEKAVVAKLKELGYIAGITKDGHSYVPIGLADANGDGPLHTNYGITIGW